MSILSVCLIVMGVAGLAMGMFAYFCELQMAATPDEDRRKIFLRFIVLLAVCEIPGLIAFMVGLLWRNTATEVEITISTVAALLAGLGIFVAYLGRRKALESTPEAAERITTLFSLSAACSVAMLAFTAVLFIV